MSLLFAMATACGPRNAPPVDPIAGIPPNQQRQLSRAEFVDTWPSIPGTGTLGCDARAVVFRAQGVTYALNAEARSRGYADVTPIVVTQSPAPSRPLGRIRQDERMRIFAASEACTSRPQPSVCRQALARSSQPTPDELTQIDAEGRERSWPPLSPPRRNPAAVIDAGLALCAR